MVLKQESLDDNPPAITHQDGIRYQGFWRPPNAKCEKSGLGYLLLFQIAFTSDFISSRTEISSMLMLSWRPPACAPTTCGVVALAEPAASSCFLGTGRQTGLIDQEDAAVTYLNTHKEKLKALACFPGVNTFILGLVWICIPEQSVFSVGPSVELMQPALDIGIFPSVLLHHRRTRVHIRGCEK